MAKEKDSGVTIVEVDRSTTEVEPASWYNQAPVSYTHLTLPTKRIV